MKNRVEELRRERGLNQGEFARAIRVSRQTVSAIETGKAFLTRVFWAFAMVSADMRAPYARFRTVDATGLTLSGSTLRDPV